MIKTNKTLANITWHPAHSQSDDTHKVMSSRTGELLQKGGIHLQHTRIAVAYVVKWSSVFKDLQGDFAEQSVSYEKKSSLWIHPSLIASHRLGHFAGETVVCASKTEIAKRIWSVGLPIRANDQILDGFYVISMQFPSLTRRRLSRQTYPAARSKERWLYSQARRNLSSITMKIYRNEYDTLRVITL